jgi:hypothetical protein
VTMMGKHQISTGKLKLKINGAQPPLTAHTV